MSMFSKWYRSIKFYLLQLERWSRKVTFPGLDGVPVYDVGLFFYNGITKGSITTRASGVAFSFYLALFPAIIFIFTLIPYIPIENFQEELLDLIHSLLPADAFFNLQGTITDIVTNQRGSLLSFGFIAALVFSTNGFSSLIDAFNATYHTIETRSWIAQRLISLLLVVIIFSVSVTAVGLVTFGEYLMDYMVDLGWIKEGIWIFIFNVVRWIIILAMFFFSISFLFYLAPNKKSRYRFISAGSTLATLLVLIISLGFSYYINNFGRYNTLYGSIGAIIALLMWLYMNAIGLLIGFELNVSIGLNQRK